MSVALNFVISCNLMKKNKRWYRFFLICPQKYVVCTVVIQIKFISMYRIKYCRKLIWPLTFDLWQDVDDYYSVRYPKLYTPGLLDSGFNKKVFVFSATEGIITSLILFFIPYFAFQNGVHYDGTDLSDHQSLGCAVASTLVVAVNLRVGRFIELC